MPKKILLLTLMSLCSCTSISTDDMIRETQKCEAVGMDAVAEWNAFFGVTAIDCLPSGHMHKKVSR